MRNKNHSFALAVFILTILIMSGLVMAAPPVQTSGGSSSLIIEYPKYDYIKLGNDHRFHVHVINATEMKTNKTTSCIFHFYNQTGYDINLNYTNMEFEGYNGVDFAITMNKTYLSSPGFYSYVIQCNSTKEVGFASAQIEVTASGREYTTADNLNYFSTLLVLIFTCVFFFALFMLVKTTPLKIFFLAMSCVMIILILGVNLIVLQQYVAVMATVTSIFEKLFVLFVILGGVSIIIFVLYSLVQALRALSVRKGKYDDD